MIRFVDAAEAGSPPPSRRLVAPIEAATSPEKRQRGRPKKTASPTVPDSR